MGYSVTRGAKRNLLEIKTVYVQFVTKISVVIVILSCHQIHVVHTPQGQDYEGRTFQGKRVSGN